MDATNDLLTPDNCAMVFIDHQAGLAFAVQSIDRQTLVNNAVALARCAVGFNIPSVVTTSASKVYSGPVLPDIAAVLPNAAIERKNMNAWEDESVWTAIIGLNRPKLVMSGLLTEACVSFPTLSALRAGYEVYVVADTCGSASVDAQTYALQRLAGRGAQITSWLQVVLELQRDWTRHKTYDVARGIIEANGGGYGIGLRYAKTMLTHS